jgi:hypothetical protein
MAEETHFVCLINPVNLQRCKRESIARAAEDRLENAQPAQSSDLGERAVDRQSI